MTVAAVGSPSGPPSGNRSRSDESRDTFPTYRAICFATVSRRVSDRWELETAQSRSFGIPLEAVVKKSAEYLEGQDEIINFEKNLFAGAIEDR